MSAPTARMIRAATDTLIAHVEELTALDQAIGDGDHGLNMERGKVALISGGGSGHEPLHAGFVGHGMLDAACPGHVFTSPTPHQMLAAAEAVETGAGALFIVKNYSGDRMNFQMAADMLERENATVVVNDDVAVENSTYTTGRRGVAGTLVVEKIVGAAAERGQEVTLLVNGFGATPLLELYLMVNAARKVLSSAGVKVARHPTGSYVTSLDMAGCSITATAGDAGVLSLRDAPVHTNALRWGM